jgi:hypothetical protein
LEKSICKKVKGKKWMVVTAWNHVWHTNQCNQCNVDTCEIPLERGQPKKTPITRRQNKPPLVITWHHICVCVCVMKWVSARSQVMGEENDWLIVCVKKQQTKCHVTWRNVT